MTQSLSSTWLVLSELESRQKVIDEAEKLPGFQYGYLVDEDLSSDEANVIISMEAENREKMKEKRKKIHDITGASITCMMSKRTK